MKERLEALVAVEGVAVDEQSSRDLLAIMKEHGDQATDTASYFQKVFFQQQYQAATHHDLRGMRWHPLMIKWCIYLRAMSSGV